MAGDRKRRAGQDVWPLIEAGWSTGKTAEELSAQFGKAVQTIHNRASAENWRRNREAVGKVLADALPAAVVARVLADAEDYVAQHLDDWQTLRHPVIEALTANWSELTDEAEAELKGKAALSIGAQKLFTAIQDGQRKALGLDKPQPPTTSTTDPAMIVPQDTVEWAQSATPEQLRARIDERLRGG